MDLIPIIERVVAVLGPFLDVVTVVLWGFALWGWFQQHVYERDVRLARRKGVPPPEPNKWVVYSRPVWFVACFFLWLSMIHWGQLQQKPIRG